MNGSFQKGEIILRNSATAGNSTIFTNKGDAGGGAGGITEFQNTSTAGNATLINDASTVPNGSGGVTLFFNSSSAGDATIINNGSAINDLDNRGAGSTFFVENSTASDATVINNGGSATNAEGGSTQFVVGSSAGNATFINNGSTSFSANGGQTSAVTADNATFINNATAVSGDIGSAGNTRFGGGSPGTSTFINNGATVSGAAGGFPIFSGNADNATFINNGAIGSGTAGGYTRFSGNADNATFINNGGTGSGAAGGSRIIGDFGIEATAGSATLIAYGGTAGGGGGLIFFNVNSDGGTSRIELFGNGSLQIADAVTVGSIEGDGNVLLFGFSLGVGSNNLSTTFSGMIQDGGFGGSLTKIGAGTLTLSGANTYIGNTNVIGGVLKVDSSILSNTRVRHGGTLAGTGQSMPMLTTTAAQSAQETHPGRSPLMATTRRRNLQL